MMIAIPPIAGISTDRLRLMLGTAMLGTDVEVSNEELLALAAHALRTRGDAIPDSVRVACEVTQAKKPPLAKVLHFPRRKV